MDLLLYTKRYYLSFRLINLFQNHDQNSGQFERTNYCRKNSQVNYLEGCTAAPQYDTNQLHAAIVELVA
jgi:Fe-S cluster assembly protein SufB